VSQNNVAGCLQDVVYRNPILPGRFHAHIFAVVFGQPNRTATQITGERRETLALVGSYSVVVGCGNAGYDKRLVDIHPTANWINDFEHNTSPQFKDLREQVGTGRSLKD
jgi:hypothetical protein